jgi:putative hydrolase of the HAD superfamily
LRGELAGRYPQRAHDFRFLRKTVLREVALDCGYSDELVEPAFSVFDDARNEVELYPDVPTALDWLAAHYRIIAVTNGNANLATIGIDHYFDDIVASADIGCAKPARRIFAEATRRAGTKACCVLHVGDHPRTDIAGAREAGLATAWMNRRNDKWPEDLSDPDATLADMSDLCRLLQAVSGPT